MRIENEIILHGRRNNQAWFAPSLAVIPSQGKNGGARVFVRVLQLTGNDIGPEHFLWTDDLGKTWTPPWESMNISKIPLDNDVFEWPAFGLYYHRKTQTTLGLGSTLFSRDRGDEIVLKSEVLVFDRPSSMACTVWNPSRGDFDGWEKLALPQDMVGLGNVITPGCGQWHETDDGTILMPFIHSQDNGPRRVGTLRMSFDGRTLRILEAGKTVGVEKMWGADEPSIVRFGDQFYMTIRSEYQDGRMYQARSDDGLNWDGFEPWRWDDGSIGDTANTQQHWLTRGDELFLVYTRKSELNNGVFRCRAPLIIAQVDPDTLRLVRASEKIVFPENGARMGNFSVANVSDTEAWIMTGEWLEQYVPGHQKGMRFWIDLVDGGKPVNRMQYIGNLLLARIRFD